MTKNKRLPVWYGVGTGNSRNVTCNIGHLNYSGFIIPKYKIMNTKKQLIEINTADLSTFSIDEISGKNYIKLYVEDYQELEQLRYYIAYAIGLMGEAHEYNKKDDDFAFALVYLTDLLKNLHYPFDLAVLDDIMKNRVSS